MGVHLTIQRAHAEISARYLLPSSIRLGSLKIVIQAKSMGKLMSNNTKTKTVVSSGKDRCAATRRMGFHRDHRRYPPEYHYHPPPERQVVYSVTCQIAHQFLSISCYRGGRDNIFQGIVLLHGAPLLCRLDPFQVRRSLHRIRDLASDVRRTIERPFITLSACDSIP